MDRSHRVNVSNDYKAPKSMSPRVELDETLLTNFGLSKVAANYQKRPISDPPGMSSSHVAGTIPVSKVIVKATKDEMEERGARKPSAAQGAASGSSFPELEQQTGKKHIADTPVPNTEEMGPKDRPKPTKAEPSKVASKPEKQEASASASQAAAATAKKYAGTGARPKGQAHATPPFMAFSSPTFAAAREATRSKIGQDDRIDSVHGHLSNRLVGLRGEMMGRVDNLTRPGKRDRELFSDIADAFRGTTQHYRERRAALVSLEHTYEEQGGLLMDAMEKRWSDFVTIYQDQERREMDKQKEVDSMRSSSAGAKQVIEGLKKDIAKLEKDNRELTGQRQAFSQAMLLRDEKLTQWRHSYNSLAQEVAQLHTERVNLLDEKILPWHKDVDIEPSTVKPPKVEKSELASGETLEDQLHGLSHDQLEITRASRWVIKNKRKPPKDLTDL